MKRTIQLGRPGKDVSPYPLFPDPTTIFHDWNDELAARILPIAPFDVAMAEEEGRSGPGVFLYTEDLDAEFIRWKVADGKIVSLEQDLNTIEPFEEAPDLDKIRDYLGGYLHFTRYEIDIGPPSQYDDWNNGLEAQYKDLGIDDGFDALRVGGGYPAYVQASESEDEEMGFIAELPVGHFELNWIDLYLFQFADTFHQEMQMT